MIPSSQSSIIFPTQIYSPTQTYSIDLALPAAMNVRAERGDCLTTRLGPCPTDSPMGPKFLNQSTGPYEDIHTVTDSISSPEDGAPLLQRRTLMNVIFSLFRCFNRGENNHQEQRRQRFVITHPSSPVHNPFESPDLPESF